MAPTEELIVTDEGMDFIKSGIKLSMTQITYAQVERINLLRTKNDLAFIEAVNVLETILWPKILSDKGEQYNRDLKEIQDGENEFLRKHLGTPSWVNAQNLAQYRLATWKHKALMALMDKLGMFPIDSAGFTED